VIEIRDVENAHAEQPLRTHRVRDTLRTAVDARAQILRRDEQEILVDGGITLSAGADELRPNLGTARVRNVPHLKAVPAALKDVIAAERQIRIREVELAEVLGIVPPSGLAPCPTSVRLRALRRHC